MILRPRPKRDRGNVGDFVRQWNKRMTQAFELANQNIGNAASYNKNKYDRKAKSVEIVAGDRVVVKNVRPSGTTRTGKLASYWEPTVFEVVQKLEGIPVFVVREFGTKKKTKTLHRNLLKRVNELVPSDPVVASQPSVNIPPGNSCKSSLTSSAVPKRSQVTARSYIPVLQPVVGKSVGKPVGGGRTVGKSPVVGKTAGVKPDVGSSSRAHKLTTSHKPLPAVARRSDVNTVSDSGSDSDSEGTIIVVERRTRRSARPRLPSLLRGRGESNTVVTSRTAVVRERVSLSEDDTLDETLEQVEQEKELVLEENLGGSDASVGSEEDVVGSDASVGSEEEVVGSDASVGSEEDGSGSGGSDNGGSGSGGSGGGGSDSGSDRDSIVEEESESETEYSDDIASGGESGMNESFYSAQSTQSTVDIDEENLSTQAQATIDLDDSLEKYPDINEPPPRRSVRGKRAPQKLEYDVLGDPFGRRVKKRLGRSKK